MVRRKKSVMFLTFASAAALAIAGCTPIGSEDPTGAPGDADPSVEAPEATTEPVPEPSAEPSDEPDAEETTEEAPEDEGPAAQANSCEWDNPKLTANVPGSLPSGQVGDLATAIIGSWQHTHYDSGEGFKVLDDEDIRYVFSSDTTLLYCQHIAGVTDHAENGADITWDDNSIVLPNGTAAYVVESWDESTMLWTNTRDGSTYLLQRR